MTQERKQYLATSVAFLIGIIVGGALMFLWVTRDSAPATPSQDETTQTAEGGETAAPNGGSDVVIDDGKITGSEVSSQNRSAAIEVFDQPAGNTVVVREATMEVDGWLVVHEGTADLIGNALGAVRRERGVHESVAIPLLRETEAGELYRVIIYRDNGNGIFSLEEDFPILGPGNAPVMTAFRAE